MNDTTKKILKWTGVYALLTLILFVIYYITLPAINIYSKGFWVFLTLALFLYLLPHTKIVTVFSDLKEGNRTSFRDKTKKPKLLLFALIPLLLMIVCSFFSSPMFFARKYASVITVKEADFATDMPEAENVTNIALMDSSTAAIVGNRTLGSLSDVISQFELSPNYTQINYRNTPQKVANLEYAGFFKWMGNRGTGIPGYVMVDPVNNTAEYKKLTTTIRYAESGYFGDDLMRRLRFDYPTKIFGTARFEVDDEGNPVYIVPCLKPRVFLFGAMDVSEVIIFDPTTGSSSLHSVDKTPEWIDVVYDGDLATQKYNWKGTLSGGFFNSIVGNKDCKQTTDDYGYIVLGDDVWYFTGVTSVNSDRSNIGFIISNARTGEYKFYPVIGAEEHSAMSAAQGEVQEKNYVASFPALINVKGEATYIMVLKDQGGLVKLYAMVNVEQYNIVATGETQEEAKAAYLARLATEGVLKPEEEPAPPAEDTVTMTLTVGRITPVTTDGETYLYLNCKDSEGKKLLLRVRIADNEKALFLEENDTATFKLLKTDTENIYTVLSFE